jgi:hypothetical protein
VSSDNIARNLRALWRADKIIADIRLRHMLVNLGMKAFAALIAAFGLLMLELAAYFALVQIWTAIVAAAALGAFNFLIAAVIFVVATRRPTGRDLELASEIHDAAIDALQLEVQALQSQFAGLFRHPLESVLPSLILPLITIAIKGLKKPKEPATAEHG